MRQFIAVLLFVVCNQPALADSRVGIRGGANIGDRRVNPNDGYDSQTRTGSTFGAAIQGSLNSSHTVYLQGFVSYADRGWFEDASYLFDVVETEIIVPEVAFGSALILCAPGEHVRPFLETGIETAVVIRRLAKANFRGSILEGEVDDYSKSNISLNLGLGLAIPVWQDEVQTEVRYNLGLKNMLDNESDQSLKTTGVQLLIGYFFTLKR